MGATKTIRGFIVPGVELFYMSHAAIFVIHVLIIIGERES